MMNYIFSLLGLVISLLIIFINYLKTKDVFSSLSIIIGLCVLDVFLPGLVYNSSEVNYFPYYYIVDDNQITWALLFFIIFEILFFLGYSLVSLPRKEELKEDRVITINLFWVKLIFWISIFSILVKLYLEYIQIGNLISFYHFKIARAYLITVESNNPIYKIFQIFSEQADLLISICTSLIIYSQKEDTLKIKTKSVVFYIVVASIFMIISLNRGNILGFCIMIFLTFQERRRNSKLLVRGIFFASILFVSYGVIRHQLTYQFWNSGEKVSILTGIRNVITQTFGVSLYSLARVLTYIENTGEIFYGQSFYERFFLFIPRLFWPSKPISYGIQTISLAMGTPSTTMDAITIPGECIINFRIKGFLVCILFGLFFGLFERLRYNAKYFFIYAALVIYMTTSAFWMGFTGISTRLFYLPLHIVLLSLITRYQASSFNKSIDGDFESIII